MSPGDLWPMSQILEFGPRCSGALADGRPVLVLCGSPSLWWGARSVQVAQQGSCQRGRPPARAVLDVWPPWLGLGGQQGDTRTLLSF